MDTTLRNEHMTIAVSAHGAELKSIVKDGRELMWSGDPLYWERRSPVLFPFVGATRDRHYRHGGRTYPMGQHGFARDMEFTLIETAPDRLAYELRDSGETRKVYPFPFSLVIAYTLTNSSVGIDYTVTNTGAEPLFFSLGAHPAFVFPFDPEGSGRYRLRFLKDGQPLAELRSNKVVTGGLIAEEAFVLPSPDGYLTPTRETFLQDALVLEEQQADRVSLVGPAGEYLRVDFHTPVLGIWSPAGADAPFVCVEPWYGRADGEHFAGELRDKAYGNVLQAGCSFHGGLVITAL